MRTWLLALAFCLSGAGFACSGPNVQAIMAAATQTARYHLIFAALMLGFSGVVSLFGRIRHWAGLVPLVVCALHPLWWLSSGIGDCGVSLVQYSLICSVASAIAAALILVKGIQASKYGHGGND